MIGIDISDNSIKLVELQNRRQLTLRTLHWSLLTHGIVEHGLIQDAGALRQAIEEALKNCVPLPPRSRQVVASFPERHTFLQVLDVPGMSLQETDEAVRWAVRPHLPYDLEQMYVSWQPIGQKSGISGKQSTVLVGAAPKNAIHPLIEVFRDLPLTLVAIEAASQALMRSLILPSARQAQNVVMLDMGATSTNIVFFSEGSMRMSTSLNRGGQDLTEALMKQLGLPAELAEKKKVRHGLGSNDAPDEKVITILRQETLNLLQAIKQEINTEIADHAYLSKPQLIILTGGGANLHHIDSLFGEVFPATPVQFGRPWAQISLNRRTRMLNLSDEDSRHYVIASGLAQRPITWTYESPDHAINLLPPLNQRRLLAHAGLTALRSLTKISLLAALILATIGALSFVLLEALVRFSPQSSDAELQQAIDSHQVVAKAYTDRNQVLDHITQTSHQTILWTEALPAVLNGLPPGLKLKGIRGRYTDHQIILSGTAASRSSIQVAENQLNNLPIISTVVSPPTNFLRQTDADFRLEITLKPAS